MLKPKGSIDARQYAAAFVTQRTLSLNDGEGSWAGLCQCDSFVMFCAPNAEILTEVSEKSFKNPVRRSLTNWTFGEFKVGLGILQITSAKRCPCVWPWVGRSLFSTKFVEFDQAV